MEIGLVTIVRVAWAAATLPIIIASLPSSRLRSFHQALLGFARRGKIMQSSSHKFTVPQRFFCHFYVLAVLWTTLLLVATWSYATKNAPSVSEPFLYSTIASYLTGGSHMISSLKSHYTKMNNIWRYVFLLLLMEAHVLRRLFESIYVFKYSPSARMHIFGYLAGLFYYTMAPLSLCCGFANEVFKFVEGYVVEFIVKGKDRMPSTEFDLWAFVNPLMKLGWSAWIGGAIFLWGWIHQRRCHSILGLLREGTERVEDYIVPHGDWFDLVSCPHYLAEIVVYAGLVVASGGLDLTIWLLFGFVVLAFSHFFLDLWWQILFSYQQKHTDGIHTSLTTTLAIDMPFFHLFFKVFVSK